MPLNRIEKTHWQPFFDRVSAALGAKSVDIDIVAPGIASETEARRIALTGLSYDSKDDIFAVIGDELEHNIEHPRQINVDAAVDSVRRVEVIDQEGGRPLIALIDPLRLPPPR